MRVHIYQEELGEGVELIRKDNVNGNETFFGLRIWLKSPQALLDHSTAQDDDRCAVTIWARRVTDLQQIVNEMRHAVFSG